MEFLVPILVVLVVALIALNIFIFVKIKKILQNQDYIIQEMSKNDFKRYLIYTIMGMSNEEIYRIKSYYQDMYQHSTKRIAGQIMGSVLRPKGAKNRPRDFCDFPSFMKQEIQWFVKPLGPIRFCVAMPFKNECVEVRIVPSLLAEHLVNSFLIRAIICIQVLRAMIHIYPAAVGRW